MFLAFKIIASKLVGGKYLYRDENTCDRRQPVKTQ